MKISIHWLTACPEQHPSCYHYVMIAKGKQSVVLDRFLDVKHGDYMELIRAIATSKRIIPILINFIKRELTR